MDTQLKKGFLDISVLCVVKDCDSYGYQIIKDLSQYMDLSESTLYPILKRMQSNGYLTTYQQEHGGRLRRYYSITPQGKKRIDEFLTEWHEVENILNYIKDRA